MIEKDYLTKNLMIQLTNNCPNCCPFCLNADGIKKNDFLSVKQVDSIIKKFKPKNVEFTGGETFSNMNLLISSVKIAKQNGVENVRINTNLDVKNINSPITKAGINRISKYLGVSLFVCLQTLDGDYYKIFRANQKASLNRVFRNIEYLLKKTGLEFVPGFVPTKGTISEFPKIYEYICNLDKKYPSRVGKLEFCKLILSGRATKEIESNFEDQIKVLRSIAPLKHPIECWCYGKNSKVLEKIGVQIHKCSFGKDSFYVTVKGKVLVDNSTGGPPLADHYSKFNVKKYISSKRAKEFVCPLAG